MTSIAELGLSADQVKTGLQPYELDEIFCQLAEALVPGAILEIGSRDFMDGLRLKRRSPESIVFAFEANPENFSEYLKNIDGQIYPLPIALGERDSIETMRVPRYASRSNDANQQQRGISSMLPREELGEAINYQVPMMTLDTFMGNFVQDATTFAMWIDVEGYAFQVINGASADLLRRCVFAKIEVEDIPYWDGQKLAPDVREFMTRHGFVEVANCDLQLKQYDILFVNRSALLAPEQDQVAADANG